MTWDGRKPSWIRGAQDRALRAYLAQDVYPYSPYYQVAFDEAGVGQRGIRSRADLHKLSLTVFDDIVNPASVVLRPDEQSIQQFARIGLVARVFWAKLWRREWVVNQQLIDPVYKPLHWHVDDGFPIGSSAEDLDRLAELGRRWLELAGVARYDVLVSVLPPGPNLAYWELVLGSRQAGVSALHLSRRRRSRSWRPPAPTCSPAGPPTSCACWRRRNPSTATSTVCAPCSSPAPASTNRPAAS